MAPFNIDAQFRPAILTWNRLEGRPRSENFERSLRAEVRDPLWMLCRQWQLKEFDAEDSGSITKAKIQIRTAHLNRYAGRNLEAVGYDEMLPLETRVEREPIPLDLMTRARLGHLWLKLIKPISSNLRARYVARFGFLGPAEGLDRAHLESDRRAWQTFEALKGRAVDGVRLLNAMGSDPDEHAAWLATAVQKRRIRNKIQESAATFRDQFLRIYSQPAPEEDASWAESYLEYQFACAAPADPDGEGQTVLVAEQYHHGQLDWYSFQLDPELLLTDKPGAEIPAPRFETEEALTFIPTPVEFPGMPNVRWWQFEDRRIDFGDLRPSTTDLAPLMLAEFGLVYGNDWSLIPYRLPVGVLAETMGIVVTDVFGVRTFVRPAVNSIGDEQGHWGMYHLKNRRGNEIDPRLFLPPVIARVQEGPALEKVILVRDEMANLVWGIEQTIPGQAEGGIDGYEAAAALERYFGNEKTSDEGIIDTGAAIRYRLGTPVRENLIPFIPIRIPESIRISESHREICLQRAAMPRLTVDPHVPVEPRGRILRSGLDETPKRPYFIHEEEIPRAGVSIRRTPQSARWWNGKRYTWFGRQKTTERSQGSIEFGFDKIDPLS